MSFKAGDELRAGFAKIFGDEVSGYMAILEAPVKPEEAEAIARRLELADEQVARVVTMKTADIVPAMLMSMGKGGSE